MSLLFSLAFIVLLRFTAGLMLWATVIAVMLLLAHGMFRPPAFSARPSPDSLESMFML